jgi:hypothetical protein
MPGEAICFRCRTALAPPAPTRLTPPRAGWTKPFRPARYWLKRKLGPLWRKKVAPSPAAAHGWASIGRERLLVAAVSLVPGLGHLLSRETPRILLLWPAWLGALALGLLLYGTTAGGLFIGAAAALHAWIICDAAAVHDAFTRQPVRFVIVLAVLGALLFGIYGGAQHGAGLLVNGAYAPMDFPSAQIHAGDFLLVDPRAYRADAPRRGDIIRYRTRAELFGPASAEFTCAILRGETVGQILAMPGEDVLWRDRQVRVCRGQELLRTVNSPAEFAALNLTLHVPSGQYFCLPPVISVALGRSARSVMGEEAKAAYVRMMGLAAAPDIYGRAFMLYEPFWQRKWLSREPRPKMAQPPADG